MAGGRAGFRCNRASAASRAGLLPLPEHFRLPLSQDDLARFNMMLGAFIKSSSFLFEPRSGDFKLEIVENELVILASRTLGPGDIECIKGLLPADGYDRDLEMAKIENQVLTENDHAKSSQECLFIGGEADGRRIAVPMSCNGQLPPHFDAIAKQKLEGYNPSAKPTDTVRFSTYEIRDFVWPDGKKDIVYQAIDDHRDLSKILKSDYPS